MKLDNYKVFLILEGLNVIVRNPITTFICKDINLAKTHFKEVIKKLKTSTYSLYEIMEITNEGLKEQRIFICSELNIQERQCTITDIRKERKQIEETKQEKEQWKILEKLFDGVRVNDKEKVS